MPDYVLPHHLEGEVERLTLMSELLDPMERQYLDQLGVQKGWRCLEIGCGNGSISAWLAQRVGPSGHVVASDLDLHCLGGLKGTNLEARKLDILHDPVEQDAYDLVTARAILHHLPEREKAVARIVSALKPGGVFLSIEPDFLPATVTQPEAAHAFWQGWLAWSVSAGIDYYIGRKMPQMLMSAMLTDVSAEGRTAYFSGGSPWAHYWLQTFAELQPGLLAGFVTQSMLTDYQRLLNEPAYWTAVVTFVASWGRKPR